MKLHGFSVERSEDCVVRSFVFPNLNINRLKLKVKAMTTASNLTRIEVLSWLLFTCAVAAATENNSGLSTFKPTGVHIPINIRSKMIKPLPEKAIGNFSLIMKIQTNNENDMKPESIISEIRNQKKQFQNLKNIETAFGLDSNNMYSKTVIEEFQRKVEGCCYICTSMCGYPTYGIDFGWGKALKATIAGNCGKNSFILMDTPNGDGIEVLACLGKQDMSIFQTNPDLLACCAIHHQSRLVNF
uniref:acyltransferase Pun1-like n=1 Tax=Erigeron canadensis TaxID=72917 RepID=UPI001CB949E4|nr:acyltransferase Pun1-like [Erigeron canadensis]